MTIIEQFLAVAEAYGQAAPADESVVSWRVFGDSKKLGAIRGGSDLQTRRFEQAMAWFSENWPSGGVWPKSVKRPSRKVEAA